MITDSAENDSAVVFLLVGAADVVDIEIRHEDVVCRSEVVQDNMNSAAWRGSGRVVGEFQVAEFDVLDVFEKDSVFDDAVGVDAGKSAGTVTIDDDGFARSTGALGSELSGPGASGEKEDAVSRAEMTLVDFG